MNDILWGFLVGVILGVLLITFFEFSYYLGKKKFNSECRIDKRFLSSPHQGFKS